MSITLLSSFLVASVLLALMPGPDNIFVLTESITKGKRNGIIISAGLASGVIVHTLLIVSGLALFIKNSETAFFVVKVFGALYMLYLAYLSYKEPPQIISEKPEGTTSLGEQSFFSLYKTGFLMNVLNPKVTLFFIAFMPQFVYEKGFSFELQILILGIIFMAQAFLIFACIAFLADKLTRFLESKVFWSNVKWIKIGVLVSLALFLLIN